MYYSIYITLSMYHCRKAKYSTGEIAESGPDTVVTNKAIEMHNVQFREQSVDNDGDDTKVRIIIIISYRGVFTYVYYNLIII